MDHHDTYVSLEHISKTSEVWTLDPADLFRFRPRDKNCRSSSLSPNSLHHILYIASRLFWVVVSPPTKSQRSQRWWIKLQHQGATLQHLSLPLQIPAKLEATTLRVLPENFHEILPGKSIGIPVRFTTPKILVPVAKVSNKHEILKVVFFFLRETQKMNEQKINYVSWNQSTPKKTAHQSSLGINRHILSWWLGCPITSETHSFEVTLPFSGGDWIPRGCFLNITTADPPKPITAQSSRRGSLHPNGPTPPHRSLPAWERKEPSEWGTYNADYKNHPTPPPTKRKETFQIKQHIVKYHIFLMNIQ